MDLHMAMELHTEMSSFTVDPFLIVHGVTRPLKTFIITLRSHSSCRMCLGLLRCTWVQCSEQVDAVQRSSEDATFNLTSVSS